jgi:hypothetical protein
MISTKFYEPICINTRVSNGRGRPAAGGYSARMIQATYQRIANRTKYLAGSSAQGTELFAEIKVHISTRMVISD